MCILLGNFCRPDILKQEMKVFFVKYNDPIYVKMEKLDIMIRLASQANIAQVLSELKELVYTHYHSFCICSNLILISISCPYYH